jgi:hypothetical protein
LVSDLSVEMSRRAAFLMTPSMSVTLVQVH